VPRGGFGGLRLGADEAPPDDLLAAPLRDVPERPLHGRVAFDAMSVGAHPRGLITAATVETAVRPHGLTGSQYGVLSVLRHHPGASGADLARACNTTPQAMNGVLATLERDSLIERQQHPTHGRILQATLTGEGQRRLEAADPPMRGLRRAIEHDFTPEDIAT
jgi:DNA-binding MarR family transcriptional regulator